MLVSQICKEDDFEAKWFEAGNAKLYDAFQQYMIDFAQVNHLDIQFPIIHHRKFWEFCFIYSVLYENKLLAPGKSGLGFGVGKEPLASLFASHGCNITATDLSFESAAASGWASTNQHTSEKNGLNIYGLCNQAVFDRRVVYENVDMNLIPSGYKGKFDFTWSSCTFEHCGTMKLAKEFLLNQMECLRPGGVAVHTTEYNLSSNEQTMEEGETVIFRRKDIEEFVQVMGDHGYEMKVDFDLGRSLSNSCVDYPPYRHNPHLKLQLLDWVSTSIGLIIRKKDEKRAEPIKKGVVMSSIAKDIKSLIVDSLLPKVNLTSYNSLQRVRQQSQDFSEIISQRDAEIATLKLQLEQKEIEAESLKLAPSELSDSVLKEMNQNRNSLKWELIDAIDQIRYKDFSIACRICGYRGNTASLEKRISYCIFGGGRLERYICPECGAIFGPLKTLLFDEAELADDYQRHYRSYSEGDSTRLELNAFYSLSPKKDGIYLNYGAGVWSNTIDMIRKDGFQIYGYEPYANIQNGYMLNKEELSKMKFDGIFSNNLIEHLQDPIHFFKDMRILLKDRNCLMAHATPCYEYRYEFTRFHLHFFTGDSINRICAKVGMKVEKIERDQTIDYINYVYQFV